MSYNVIWCHISYERTCIYWRRSPPAPHPLSVVIPEVVSVHKHKSMHKHKFVVSYNFPTCSISVSCLSVLCVVTIDEVAVVCLSVWSVLSVLCVVTIGDMMYQLSVLPVFYVCLFVYFVCCHHRWCSSCPRCHTPNFSRCSSPEMVKSHLREIFKQK